MLTPSFRSLIGKNRPAPRIRLIALKRALLGLAEVEKEASPAWNRGTLPGVEVLERAPRVGYPWAVEEV